MHVDLSLLPSERRDSKARLPTRYRLPLSAVLAEGSKLMQQVTEMSGHSTDHCACSLCHLALVFLLNTYGL